MIHIIKLIVSISIIGLFVYSKLHVHENRLSPSFMRIYKPFKDILSSILLFLNKFFKPYRVGNGLFIDMSQIVLLIALLVILMI